MRKQFDRLFLREKPVLAILAVADIEQAYAAQVARRIDSTVPHTCSILREFEELGLITSRPVGRINYLELTDRGKNIASALRDLSSLLQGPGDMRQKLERLQQLVNEAREHRDVLRLGPLRRDLAMIISKSDGNMRQDAQELDRDVLSLVHSHIY
jgi:DNA-binding MarR family transcriptional regulator